MTAHLDPTQARAVLAELRVAYDRARADLAEALEDPFVPDVPGVDETDEDGANVIVATHDSAGEDLRSIVTDHLDWPMENAWRRAARALS